MKIQNTTTWRTADLRAILTRVARDELNDTDTQRRQRRLLTVKIAWSRRGRQHGRAWLRGTLMKLWLPKDQVNPVVFAWLAAHELAHIRGMDHRAMPGWLRWCKLASLERYSWAKDFPIRQQAPKPKPAVTDQAQAKLAHAEAMLAKAVTRRKRATTLEAKWRKRVRYYQTRTADLAAAAGEKKDLTGPEA